MRMERFGNSLELAVVLLRQNTIMVMYGIIGYILFKRKLVTNVGSGEFGKLLLYAVMPMVILNAYSMPFSMELLRGVAISALLAALCLGISMLVSRVAFKHHPIENFGTAFSNAGFIGIPLVQASLGDEAVLYVSSYVAFLTILQWTYGVFVITKDKHYISPKKIITSPVVISLLLGLSLFVFSIELPTVMTTVIKSVSAMNGPLAMIIMGSYLAQMPIKEIAKGKVVYTCALVRLVVIPVICLAVLSLLPKDYEMIKMTLLIVAAAPVGANVSIFAQAHGKDYLRSVKIVCFTTICCIITLPLTVLLASMLWS